MSAFGAGSRIRLLYALLRPERSVDELAKLTGLSASVVSQQLRVLRLYRMVEGRRDGRHVRYSISDEHVVDLLAAVRAHVDHLAGSSDHSDAASTSTSSST
jgi:ArsR family transcriptional regulator